MPPTLVTVQGSLYDAKGSKITSGRLTFAPSAFIKNGTFLISANPVTIDIPISGDLSFSLSPSYGVPYIVTFDPDPTNTGTPLELKSGYFKKSWVVPSSGPVNISSL